jgi:hypothetical protein
VNGSALTHLQALVGERQLLDRDVAALGVERPRGVLDDPRAQQLPGHDHLGVVLVLQRDDDRPQRVLIAIADLVEPPVEVDRADDPALERDVGDLLQAGELADRVLLVVAVAILGDRDLELDRRALAEPGLDPLGVARPEVDDEVELVVRAVSETGHRALLVRGRADASAGDGCELSVRPQGYLRPLC